MSSERAQPTIQDYASLDPHEIKLAGEGAQYGTATTESTEPPQRGAEGVCLNCGADIPTRIGRVVGDNDGCVPACAAPECREDVLDDHQLRNDQYKDTVRLNLYLLNEKRGLTVDNSAGGRR